MVTPFATDNNRQKLGRLSLAVDFLRHCLHVVCVLLGYSNGLGTVEAFLLRIGLIIQRVVLLIWASSPSKPLLSIEAPPSQSPIVFLDSGMPDLRPDSRSPLHTT